MKLDKFNSKSKLFEENIVYKPFAYEWAIDIDKRHEAAHWIEDEIPLGDDVTQWKNGKILPSEKAFVTNILKMFTTSDILVGTTYYRKLIPNFLNNEITNMLGGFAAREKIHQRAYALLNDTLGIPESDYSAFLRYKEMKDKAEYILESKQDTLRDLALTLAKNVFSEGVSLFASFVMLLNFQRFGKLMGISKVIEWSIRDETIHVEGVSNLFRTVCDEHKRIVTDKFKAEIYDTARTFVSLEDAFIDMVYENYHIEGLGKEEVKQYIRYITDRRLIQLGLKPNYGISDNPLEWLDWILGASQHTNFFENKVSEYEVAGLQGEEEDMKDKKFYMVSRDGCPYCVKAEAWFIDNGFEYEKLKINDQYKRNEFYDEHGWTGSDRSVPKIWDVTDPENKIYIGGYTDLIKQEPK